MPRPLGPVFHPAAVRDALGLVRLLWLDEKDSSFGDDGGALDVHLERMNLLTSVGKTLARCLSLGRGNPDTVGGRAAIHQSAEAMDELVAAFPDPLVRRAHERVVSWRPRKETEADHKRKVREGRG